MTSNFPEQWKEVELKNIAKYINDKVTIENCKVDNYITTTNMIQNKGGIVESDNLPKANSVNSFKMGDVLVSNIRPYFKKIWFATFDGTSSTDVLTFRGEKYIHNKFLYYVLANDSFFDYTTKSAKGTKMPRGDKQAIMNYLVPELSFQKQEVIAKTLSCLDDKIESNNKINKNLEQQAQAIFKHWFVDFEFPDENGNPYRSNGGEMIASELGMIPNGWRVDILDNFINRIDNRGKTAPYEKCKTNFPMLDVATLRGDSRVVDYNKVAKYVSEETYNNWFRNGHPENNDILISTVGSLAEMKLFIGDVGCIAQNVVAMRAKKISPFYLYEYLKFIKNDLISYDIGTVQPSIKITHIIKHPILSPEKDILNSFHNLIEAITKKIYLNDIESQKLSTLRDTLLPKLMSGELRIPLD